MNETSTGKDGVTIHRDGDNRNDSNIALLAAVGRLLVAVEEKLNRLQVGDQ